MKPKLPPRLADHPTVRAVRARADAPVPDVIDADWLRQLCLDAGADDVAFAGVDDPALDSEREHVEAALPGVRSYISLVVKMNRDNVRSTTRSVANQEFHRSGEIINGAAHRITRALEDAGADGRWRPHGLHRPRVTASVAGASALLPSFAGEGYR